jgi:hypothetical protein
MNPEQIAIVPFVRTSIPFTLDYYCSGFAASSDEWSIKYESFGFVGRCCSRRRRGTDFVEQSWSAGAGWREDDRGAGLYSGEARHDYPCEGHW